MVTINSVFGDVLPDFTFVDVGAMSLGQEPYEPLLKQGVGRVIGFEPVPEECARLNQLHQGSQHRFFPYIIGDGSTGTFNLCKYPMTSSLFLPNTDLLDKFLNLGELMQVVHSEHVATKRLDDIAEVSGADYLKMDVQGAELSILQGARNLLKEVMIVHTEVEFVPMYSSQPLFADIDKEMREHGFLLHKFINMENGAFAVDDAPARAASQLLWSDAVYVKDFTLFEGIAPRKLLKMAIMLHEIYRSFDLCALALKVFDGQTGFKLYQRYCRSIGDRMQRT